MPFDAIDTDDMDAFDRAMNQYAVRCADRAGQEVAAEPKFDIGSTFRITRTSFGLLTESDARKYGLLNGPLQTSGRTVSAAQNEALESCSAEARERLTPEIASTYDVGIQLINDASQEYFNGMADVFRQNEIAVRHCVVSAGWSPVDPGKVDDPSVSPAELFGVTVAQVHTDNSTGKQAYQPTAEETKLSIAQAKCRQSLDIFGKSLETAGVVQQKFVDANETRLAQFRSDMAAAARAAQVLNG